MVHRILCLALAGILLQFSAAAQIIDADFSPLITRPGDVEKLRLLPDGKFIAAGSFTMANRIEESSVARFNPDGTLDQSFQSGIPFSVTALAIQPDGKVIIGGSYTDPDTDGLHILRLNTDGSQDLSFQAGTIPAGTINDIEVEFNGTILVGGAFTIFDGMQAQGLVRLNTNGSLSQIIPLNPGTTIFVSDLITQVNGRFAIGGTIIGGPNGPEGYISYRTYNGQPVNNFTFSSNLPGVNNFMTSIRDIALDNLGRIVLTSSTFLVRYAVVVLNVDGSINNWSDIFGIPMALALSPDGDIMVAGEFNNTNAVHRYVPNAGLDYYDFGAGADGVIRQLAFYQDGSYVIGGNFSAFNGQPTLGLAHFDEQGIPDLAFDAMLERPGRINSIARYDDNRVCIGGDFAMVGDLHSVNVARLMLSNGSMDPAFNSPNISYRNTINTVAVDAEGRMLLGGTNNATGNSMGQSPLLRLTSTGAIDPAFTVSPLPLGDILHILPLPGGQVLTGGDFTVFDPGIVAQNFALYNFNGTLNENFSDRISGEAGGLFRRADGRILVAGENISLDGGPASTLLQLSTNLQPDPAFNAPANLVCTGDCQISFAEQPDGALLLAGQFAVGPDSCLTRLLPNGQLDPAFDLPGFFSAADEEDEGAPAFVGLLANESILTVGPVDSIGNTPIPQMVLLENNGLLLETLDEEGFETQRIRTALVLDENTFLIGGQLEDAARPNHYGLARVSVPIVIEGLIRGQVRTKTGEPIVGAFVTLSGSANGSTITDNNGEFGFIHLEAGLPYTVTVSLDEAPFNGVSTFDLILINQHILGVQPFDDPYDYLAADINNTSSITILDMIGIRRAILGQVSTLGNSPSWKFVTAGYNFPDPQNPWLEDFSTAIEVNELPSTGVTDADFIGIKMGDINGDADPGN
ncbi:carboxypeptidase regulatory-like domain-containing protein [Phaeodactylibacter xiamenensis]|uniref:carboxypeptidase regulatory-like domain-containing protein n=1 Tax=Phaeodactylibacter xiamenensis TaxID=1524460 RepID=UPI0024A7DFD3|nr:carboxypeptidase regulatory-like domain-containing protein [Phaeodactylibacter xiamenensis]